MSTSKFEIGVRVPVDERTFAILVLALFTILPYTLCMSQSTPLFDFAPTKQTEKKPPAAPKPLPVPPAPLSVTDLTRQIQSHIEIQFESLWVVGQVSNLTYHRSGHVYFTLKDEGAQLPAIIWKTSATKIKFKLKEGMEIVCRGRLTVFPPQGKYQMVVSEVQAKGIGTLELAFQ